MQRRGSGWLLMLKINLHINGDSSNDNDGASDDKENLHE